MHIPSYLKYKPKQVRVQHTAQYTGNLDFARAQAKDPKCWKKEDVAAVEQKKIIVLSDYKFEHIIDDFDEYTLLNIIKPVEDLIKSGFTVYYWQEPEPIQINASNVGLLISKWFVQKNRPAHPQKIYQKMAEKGISHEALAIIDMNRLEDLVNGMEQPELDKPKPVDVNILSCMRSSYSWREIASTFVDPRFTCDAGLEDIARRFASRKKVSVAIKDTSRMEVFSTQEIDGFIQQGNKIKNLVIRGQLSAVEMDKVLSAGTHLQLLDMNFASYPLKVSLTGVQLPNITSLKILENEYADLNQCRNTVSLISQMLKFMPNLSGINLPLLWEIEHIITMLDLAVELNKQNVLDKKLNIEGFSLNTNEQILLFLERFNHLSDEEKALITVKRLGLGDETEDVISYELLEKILESGLKFEKLVIKNLELPRSDAPALPWPNYILVTKQTEVLKLISENKLTKLEITRADNFDILHENKLERLTDLSYRLAEDSEGKTLNVADLQHFAPNLAKLSLFIDYNKCSLSVNGVHSSITDLNLTLMSETTTSMTKTHEFLRSLPNLEKLKITKQNSDVVLASAYESEFFEAINNIQYFECENTNGQPFPLHLALQLPHLTHLNLTGPINESAFNNLANAGGLPAQYNLQEITLKDGGSFSEHFAQVVARSPNLRKITIKNMSNLDSLLLALSETQLLELEEIIITSCDLSIQGYQLLRKIAPNLNKIELSLCPACQDLETGEDSEVELEVLKYWGQPEGTSGRKLIGRNEHKNEHRVDPATQDLNNRYEVQKVFYNLNGNDPDPNHYRNSTFDTIQFGQIQTNPFQLINVNDAFLTPYQQYTYGEKNFQQEIDKAKNTFKPALKAHHMMKLTNEFQPLPSLDCYEQLVALYVDGLAQDDIEIAYSQRDNMYCIRKRSPGEINARVNFLLDMSFTPPPLQQSKYSELIYRTVQEYRGPGVMDYSFLSPYATGEEFLESMFSQRLGRCELRAIQIKHMLKKYFGENYVRVVTNDCHAFIEIFEEGYWRRYDLGGHPAELIVKEGAKPDEIISPIKPTPPQTHDQKPAFFIVPKEEQLNPQHITWKTQEVTERTPALTALHALNQVVVDASGQRVGQNVLLQCLDDDAVDQMQLTLLHTAIHSNKEVFVVDSPEQIACAAKWIERNLNDNSGKICPGPGGPLHDFLTQDFKDKTPILIVNWNKFTADELVRFNTLIDAVRHADGTTLPKEMVVVGLYNPNKPDAYTGSDFYSRNNIKLKLPFRASDIKGYNDSQAKVLIPEGKKLDDAVEIELYNASNWREILLGQWAMVEGKLVFEEGPLATAIKLNQSVHLKNAPWHLSDFQRFWQQAKITNAIPTQGEKLILKDNFWTALNQSQGFNWSLFAGEVEFVTENSQLKTPIMMNSGMFNQFIDHYVIHNQQATKQASCLRSYENQTVQLLLTHELSQAHWAKLFNEAQKYHVRLQIGVPDGIPLPSALTKAMNVTRLKDKRRVSPSLIPELSQASLIESSDVDYSINSLKHVLETKPLVVDVTEFNESDILHQVGATVDEQSLRFFEKYSEVWQKLQQGETVILKGHFSQSLKDRLMPLLNTPGQLVANDQVQTFSGRLIVVADEPFSHAFKAHQYTPTLKEKLAMLAQDKSLSSAIMQAVNKHPWPKGISFAQLTASVQHYLHSKPPSFDITEGIITLEKPEAGAATFDLSEEHIEKVCDEFINVRMNSLMNILSYAPFAFIAGQTGVGKSTFIERYMTPENGFILHNEMSQIRAWAKDRTPGKRKILFLDEANISDKDYTLFEGLYEIPPFVVVDGEILELTSEHQVVLAGNPMSYGGERHLPKLLDQHGNACTFHAMPPEYIFREILKPIFAAAKVPHSSVLQYSQNILKIYLHVCSLSNDEILMTPRELKMMAMMMVANPNANPQDIVYRVALQCLPTQKQGAFTSWFTKEHIDFKPTEQTLPVIDSERENAFIITPSRLPIYNSLHHLLSVREIMVSSPEKVLQTSGLGGMVLEGEPGTGKSHFFMDALLDQGYQPIKPPPAGDKLPTLSNPKQFYYIPASLAFDEKKRILLMAFEQGALVVTDEINSGPMMEQLLNALLMGKHPETKQGPGKPGFMLLATQNPISMAGRQATSRALLRRLLFQEFPALSESEMNSILMTKFKAVPPGKIAEHVKAHTLAVHYAKAHHLEPAPVFRDLYKIVEIEHINTLRTASQLLSDTLKSIADQKPLEKSKRVKPLSSQYEQDAKEKARLGKENLGVNTSRIKPVR